MMRWIAVVLGVAVSACAAPAEEVSASDDHALIAPDDPPPEDPPPSEPVPTDPEEDNGILGECQPEGAVTCHHGTQGRALLGPHPNPDAYNFYPPSAYWSVPGKPPLDPLPAGQEHVDLNGLKFTSGGTRLNGLQLVGLTFGKSQGFPFCTKIAGFAGTDARGRGRYVVRYSSTCTDTFVEWPLLCAFGDYAYVAPGSFHIDGNIASGDDGTFVCGRSAAGKSFRWGYSPFNTVSGNKQLSVFHASTRMARADWCGMGIPGTMDGTPIVVFDVFNLTLGGVTDPADHVPPAGDRPFRFEAAWQGGGRNQPVLCLSKLRWQSMVPGGPCKDMLVNPLPDPRLRGSGGKYCEDLATGVDFRHFLLALTSKGARVFSASQLNELGLWAWWTHDGLDHFATTRGTWSCDDPEPPADGDETAIDDPESDRSSHLAQIWANPDAGTHRVPLYVHKRTGGTERYTTTDPAPAGYDPGEIIGYVYDDPSFIKPPMTPVLLRTWKKGDDRMLVAGEEGPPRIVGGWGLERTEGYGFLIPGPKP